MRFINIIIIIFIKLLPTYSLGINIATGQITDSHITDDIWISWMKTNNITPKIKYFWRDTNQLQKQLDAWQNNTSAIISIQNHELPLSIDQSILIINTFKNFNQIIKAFTIGNELDAQLDPDQFNTNVINSMKNLDIVMKIFNITIPITTPLTMSIFGWENMILQNEWRETIIKLFEFYNDTNSYVMFNIYPYLSWYNHKNLYTLDYALTNMFSDKITQINKIINSCGFNNMKLIIGETGWPTSGNDDANIINSYKYWQNINILPYDIYWFELIDEDNKPGSLDEHYYGLFTKDGKYKFNNINL